MLVSFRYDEGLNEEIPAEERVREWTSELSWRNTPLSQCNPAASDANVPRLLEGLPLPVEDRALRLGLDV